MTAPSETMSESEVLLRLGTATLYEASKLNCYLPPRIRGVWSGARVVGRAFPVRTAPADNLPLHLALEQVSPGDVLVVDGRQEACGYWGEVMTVSAQTRGVVGLIMDGGVRDVDAIQRLGFPVFASAIAIPTTIKQSSGVVGDPIEIEGTPVSRGDLVVADTDGIIVIPQALLDSVIAEGLKREAAEAGYLERLRNGELTLDIYGLRPDGA